jgi:hypothetical protein
VLFLLAAWKNNNQSEIKYAGGLLPKKIGLHHQCIMDLIVMVVMIV